MLNSFVKHRPKQLLAVYVEPQQVEVLRAHRHWRSWQIDSVEQLPLPEGESLFEYLQRLNLRPRGRQGTALVLFLPRTYYTFHREHYPATLQDQLEEALGFDWAENILHDVERSLHFFGPPVPVNRHLSVPIFSLQKDLYEKFYQVCGGSSFDTFSVIPSALTYKALLTSSMQPDGGATPLEIVGRLIDPLHMEVHRFYKGQLLDSAVVGKDHHHLTLFRESLRCIEKENCQGQMQVHLFCENAECHEQYAREWAEESLSLKLQPLNGALVAHWVKYLLQQDEIQTFEAPLVLKPWEVPRVTWLILLLVTFYSVFSFYQVHSHDLLQETSRRLKKQSAQLETQWKPIEQLQTRISKFQEDQKTLSEFNLEGYPLLEILTLLSRITQDDTWLNYLSLRKGQFLLRGESNSAIKYLSELAKVDGFDDVRFASPVTRNPASDKERFNIQIQIDVEKLKTAINAMPPEKDEKEVGAETGDDGTVSASPGPAVSTTGDESVDGLPHVDEKSD